jgi:hypothetical protein
MTDNGADRSAEMWHRKRLIDTGVIQKTCEYRFLTYFITELEDCEAAVNLAAVDGWRFHSHAIDGTHLVAVIERETLR